ncbi:MAG: RsmD family RNA methyltransferase [Tannerellaceae bacterium]|jgi:16S rRNA (guanine(966)-N(2))-methyltransferase RsmD|nr:RsmD family RNA methyltransferase [Tannerellaceae bacterium]
MRIISGIYGRRRFAIPPNFNARPTTDFAKENLFNVLANIIDLDGAQALDLFAGTGSISFELLSRGCACVTAVENNRRRSVFIAKVASELSATGFNLVTADAFRFMRTWSRAPFDLIFADPPYAMVNLAAVPILALRKGLLKKGGLFIMEHSSAHSFTAIPEFVQQRVYGSVNFSFFEGIND